MKSPAEIEIIDISHSDWPFSENWYGDEGCQNWRQLHEGRVEKRARAPVKPSS